MTAAEKMQQILNVSVLVPKAQEITAVSSDAFTVIIIKSEILNSI